MSGEAGYGRPWCRLDGSLVCGKVKMRRGVSGRLHKAQVGGRSDETVSWKKVVCSCRAKCEVHKRVAGGAEGGVVGALVGALVAPELVCAAGLGGEWRLGNTTDGRRNRAYSRGFVFLAALANCWFVLRLRGGRGNVRTHPHFLAVHRACASQLVHIHTTVQPRTNTFAVPAPKGYGGRNRFPSH